MLKTPGQPSGKKQWKPEIIVAVWVTALVLVVVVVVLVVVYSTKLGKGGLTTVGNRMNTLTRQIPYLDRLGNFLPKGILDKNAITSSEGGMVKKGIGFIQQITGMRHKNKENETDEQGNSDEAKSGLFESFYRNTPSERSKRKRMERDPSSMDHTVKLKDVFPKWSEEDAREWSKRSNLGILHAKNKSIVFLAILSKGDIWLPSVKRMVELGNLFFADYRIILCVRTTDREELAQVRRQFEVKGNKNIGAVIDNKKRKQQHDSKQQTHTVALDPKLDLLLYRPFGTDKPSSSSKKIHTQEDDDDDEEFYQDPYDLLQKRVMVRNASLEHCLEKYRSFDYLCTFDPTCTGGFARQGFLECFNETGWHSISCNGLIKKVSHERKGFEYVYHDTDNYVGVRESFPDPPKPMDYHSFMPSMKNESYHPEDNDDFLDPETKMIMHPIGVITDSKQRDQYTLEQYDDESRNNSYAAEKRMKRVRSGFGGCVLYPLRILNHCRYSMDSNEHASLHLSMQEEGFDRQYINPRWIVYKY